MLSNDQLKALRRGLRDGFLLEPCGLVTLGMVQARHLYDDVRQRQIPTGDYELTGWGRLVAANYEKSVSRLPTGTVLNHRIDSYTRASVRLADDSGSVCTVDVKRPIRLSGSGDGCWDLPIRGGGHTPASLREAWYVRNLLGMRIELHLGEYGTPNDLG